MKKVILFSIIAIFTITNVKAQNTHWGIKGGLNIANLQISSDNKISSDTDYKFSFYLGGMVEYSFSENLYGELGIQYTNNGVSTKSPLSNDKIYLTLHQINVPVTLKYKVDKSLILKGGGYIGKIGSISISSNDWNSENFSSNTKDYGALVGADFNLNKKLFFEIVYNYGMENLSQVNLITTKNRVFQIGLGYKF